MKKKLIDLYLMYWTEFLTIGAFADYVNATGVYSKDELLEDKKVLRIIRIGRKLYLKRGF